MKVFCQKKGLNAETGNFTLGLEGIILRPWWELVIKAGFYLREPLPPLPKSSIRPPPETLKILVKVCRSFPHVCKVQWPSPQAEKCIIEFSLLKVCFDHRRGWSSFSIHVTDLLDSAVCFLHRLSVATKGLARFRCWNSTATRGV